MRKKLGWATGLLLTVLVIIMMVIGAQRPADAYDPPPVVSCSSIKISLDLIKIRCSAAGLVVLDTNVELPVREIIKTVEVLVPGPRATETVRVPVPGDTETVRVAGPTIKVPGPTETITVSPDAVSGGSNTVSPTATKTTSVSTTETVTVSPSGQAPSPSVTVVPSTPEPEQETIIDRIPGPVKVIGFSSLALLLLVGLIVLGMWLGYYMGYKNADKENARFMTTLRDKMLVRGKHR